MFTGIVEEVGEILEIKKDKGNLNIYVAASMTSELKIDQSVAHNGVCLTVVAINDNSYLVTAIQETLDKSNLGSLSVGDSVNLERGMKLGARLDGHLVQGHVDQTAECVDLKEENGSWVFTFNYDPALGNITIEKGSITINGVSLTVVNSEIHQFSVAIIPYTYEHTTFKSLKVGEKVNLEFDVIGKYVKRLTQMA
ncbi:riboflavin synthase alpha chain [Gillisia mitskevichiae]|uniref:Riboflavin synthase n=1 Tax=Gillisia mitskevichiae TaxID=270921 RepID=A0A495PY39_9FLAO|nr:riboflavin synthase [Gillisia mitskevichiae]RKS55346.1 riboflavin synthase alpha chain [Gillisia mitskevichiae]